MSPADHMETIIQSMIQNKANLVGDKELLFKVKARKHNPRIPESDIQRFWDANSHRC